MLVFPFCPFFMYNSRVMLQGQRPRATLQCSAGSCPRATFQLNVKYVCIILCDIKLENIFSGCKMLFVYVIKSQLYEKTVFLIKNISFAIFSAGSAPPRDASVAVRIYNNIVLLCDIKVRKHIFRL